MLGVATQLARGLIKHKDGRLNACASRASTAHTATCKRCKRLALEPLQMLRFDAAEHSVYRWWWEFLRLSPVFWYAQRTGLAPSNKQMAQVCEQAGNLSKPSFMAWWQNTGRLVFAEQRKPNKLRLLDVDGLEPLDLYPEGTSVVIEVPLNVTTRTLIKDFRQLLADQPQRDLLNVLDHSNATWRLHTKRYNLLALKNQYEVLLYKLLYPNIAVWRIGDRLQISPGLNVRDVEHTRYFDGETHPRNKLQATVGRYLYKAQRTLWNAETGLGFPNNRECKPVAMPFGKRQHLNYMAAITSTRDQPSEWSAWLHAEFHEDLVQQIKRKNRIRGTAALDLRLIQRLPAFVAGTSDLLA